MPPSIIAVVNQSSLVDDADVSRMARACAHQLRYDAAPVWGLVPSSVIFYHDPSHVPPGAHTIALVDTDPSGSAGALGWHTEDAGGIHGIVAAKPVLDAGGKALVGDWSVSSVLAHEILEMFVDPSCRGWESSDDGYDYAREVGDPVEGPTYTVQVGKSAVSVCDFALPSWFDNNATAPYDHLGALTRPFTLLKTGYVVKSRAGREQQQFGEDFPAWRRQMKAENPLSRTNARRRQK